MQNFRKEAKLVLVWLFILCSSVGTIAAQSQMDGVSIRLFVSDPQFSKATKPTATIVVENRSGKQIALSEFTFFSLELELSSKPYKSCRLDECYSAALSPGKKKIENGGWDTFLVELNDHYWHNSISSIEPANQPKNLLSVPWGEYKLHARLSRRAENWTEKDPRYEAVKSNAVVLVRKP